MNHETKDHFTRAKGLEINDPERALVHAVLAVAQQLQIMNTPQRIVANLPDWGDEGVRASQELADACQDVIDARRKARQEGENID